MNTPFQQRRRALQTQMVERRLSGLLVMQPANWYYLSGFSGEAGALLLLRCRSVMVTDGRFTAQAKQETSGIRVVAQKGSLTASVGAWLKTQRRSRIGFDASQLTVAQLRALRAAARQDRKSTRLNSSHQIISYAVFCLKKKK